MWHPVVWRRTPEDAMPLEKFRDYHEHLKLSNPKRSFRLHVIDRPGLIIPVGHHL